MEPQTPLALPPEHKNNRKFIIIVASVFVLIALIMVAIGFVVFNNPCFEENYLGYELGPKCAYSLKPYNIESSSDVSNWKTYRNDEYGFEFKYPKDYPSKDISNGVIVLPTPENCQCDVPDGLRVYAYQSFDDFKKTKNNVLDLNMFMQENFWLFGSTTKNINAIEWTCGDQEGPGALEMCISQNSNGNIFLLYFNLQDSIKNQILSTFKFLNSTTTDISNWNTYRNEEYGFEFKHPKDWELISSHGSFPGMLKHIGSAEGFEEIYIFRRSNKENLNSKDFFLKHDKNNDEYSIVDIDGVKAVRANNTGDNFFGIITEIPLQNNKTVLTLGVERSYSLGNSYDDYLGVYNNILSTFKFIK